VPEPHAVIPTDAEGLRTRIQKALDDLLAGQADVLDEVGSECAPMVVSVSRLLAGGKRLRPAFCYWGWRAAGGPDDDAIVRAAASLELFQAAALIHDDVMDVSDTRRGMPAVHRQFAALHAAGSWAGDSDHFGHAGAILSGDLCLSWSDEMLWCSGLDTEALRRGKPVFDRMRTQLMGGQYLDMLSQALAAGHGADEETGGDEDPVDLARRVIRFKSAKYTVEHPLLLGGRLAGADDALLRSFSAYGLPLGEAFQLRDDVLGVFGNPERTGKPAGDDLRAGKRTVLVALALRCGTPAQAAEIRRLLGHPDLDAVSVDRLREVIAGTGALSTVEDMIDELVRDAHEALAISGVGDPAHAVLSGLVDAATSRVA
jgi:geranylgeranyl diphosphate synthase, type I